MLDRPRDLRLLLVDDHPVMRAGVRTLFLAQPGFLIVGEAGDGMQAVQLVQKTEPDVVVMDVSLPELGGAEATKQILAARPDLKVLALSAHDDPAFVRSLMSAGASGYALKRSACAELVRAARVVAHGGTYVDPSLVRILAPAGRRRQRAAPGSAAVRLSEREAEVVRLTARGHTSKEIAESLGLSPRTLETYKARAMTKLSLGSRADLIRYALRSGWLQDV